jgi:D-arabinose 1-dehydrogenase-like Zn-dependent alcohol dehydrogenase
MVIADARFAFPLGEAGRDVALAPLLCAGLIGWRSLVIAGNGKNIGLYGFGAAAHILAQVALNGRGDPRLPSRDREMLPLKTSLEASA